jgi:hypothetical protein
MSVPESNPDLKVAEFHFKSEKDRNFCLRFLSETYPTRISVHNPRYTFMVRVVLEPEEKETVIRAMKLRGVSFKL